MLGQEGGGNVCPRKAEGDAALGSWTEPLAGQAPDGCRRVTELCLGSVGTQTPREPLAGGQGRLRKAEVLATGWVSGWQLRGQLSVPIFQTFGAKWGGLF